MRKLYSLAGAALLLGCMDDASKTTAPQLSGAVVGVSADRDGIPNGGNQDQSKNPGEKLDVTLLSGDEEVPPRVTDANGGLTVRLSDDGQTMYYTLVVKDIRDIVQAHIHMAAKGVNGSIIVWLFPSARANAVVLPPNGGPVRELVYSGQFTAADFRSPFAGQPMSVLVDAIQAGNAYGNVHTTTFPGGEIRGQLDVNEHGH